MTKKRKPYGCYFCDEPDDHDDFPRLPKGGRVCGECWLRWCYQEIEPSPAAPPVDVPYDRDSDPRPTPPMFSFDPDPWLG